jgi:hypothetical protein
MRACHLRRELEQQVECGPGELELEQLVVEYEHHDRGAPSY